MTLTKTLNNILKYETGWDILSRRSEEIDWTDRLVGLGKLGIGLAELVLLYNSFEEATSGQFGGAKFYAAQAINLEAFKYALNRVYWWHDAKMSAILKDVVENATRNPTE